MPFHWRGRYGNSCVLCEKISQFDGQTGICFLRKMGGSWLFTRTGTPLCGDPFPIDDRDAMVSLIRQRGSKLTLRNLAVVFGLALLIIGTPLPPDADRVRPLNWKCYPPREPSCGII